MRSNTAQVFLTLTQPQPSSNVLSLLLMQSTVGGALLRARPPVCEDTGALIGQAPGRFCGAAGMQSGDLGLCTPPCVCGLEVWVMRLPSGLQESPRSALHLSQRLPRPRSAASGSPRRGQVRWVLGVGGQGPVGMPLCILSQMSPWAVCIFPCPR